MFHFYIPTEIILPYVYRQKVRGLCGNFDGNRRNDLMKPDGTQATNVQQFGESWRVWSAAIIFRKFWKFCTQCSMKSLATNHVSLVDGTNCGICASFLFLETSNIMYCCQYYQTFQKCVTMYSIAHNLTVHARCLCVCNEMNVQYSVRTYLLIRYTT